LPDQHFKDVLEEVGISAKRFELLDKYYERLAVKGELKSMIDEEENLRGFEEFFSKATKGFKMWSAQRAWAKRLLRKESFCIIAPTGTGKTVFSIIAVLFKALTSKPLNRKFYIAFPTTPLLTQSWKKLVEFARNVGYEVCTMDKWDNTCLKVVCVHSRLSKREREFFLDRLKTGDFDVLLTTSAYMHRHSDIIPRGVYDLVIMDDVDAVLRSGKAVRRLLNILGIRDSDIDKGLELVKLRAKISVLPPEEAAKIRPALEALEKEVEAARKAVSDTILIVNSATGRPRGIYSKLFRVFLKFEAGSKPEAIRNIVDAYIKPPWELFEEAILEVTKRLKDGLLIFVPIDKGIEYAEYIAAKLREQGIRAETFHAKKQLALLEKFYAGEIDVLVGVATYYGIMVRGIDLPERVKYVLFAGIPRHKFSTRLEAISPTDLLRLLVIVREVLDGEERERADILIGRIARRLRTLSQGAIAVLREKFVHALQGKVEEETPLIRDLLQAYEILREKLSKPEILDKLRGLGDIAIVQENSDLYILIPDVATYIQASGRCSRLYPGGITKGLSIIVVDDDRLLNGLTKRLRWIIEGFKILELKDVNLDELIEEIERERELVKKIVKGEIQVNKQLELVKTALLVVESPNKARTIANFFGKPSVRLVGDGVRAYEVTLGNYVLNIVATGGHVYDLIVDTEPPEARGYPHLFGVIALNEGKRFIPVYTDIKTCLSGHQFTDEATKCPKCGQLVIRKLSVINAIRKLASEVDEVFIGTDPDAEGEKIAWDLRALLEPYAERIKRVEFHEVTPRAIINAINNPRDFDNRLVEAQIVRRVEDRWLGFALSEMVQKYAWQIYCVRYLCGKQLEDPRECHRPNRNLSAGRVQTPVLGYVIEEYAKHKDPAYSSYVVTVVLEGGRELQVVLTYEDVVKLGLVDHNGRLVVIGKKSKSAKPMLALASAEVLDEYEQEIPPQPPFTTDVLLEEASRLLGFSASKTMELAQDLFEMGFITYHRTDSTRVSDVGLEIARQYLEDRYGKQKLHEVYRPRTWGVGGAHEAIRPTRPIDADHLAELIKEGAIVVVGRVTRGHIRLYDLIFRRFIASQMKPAKALKQKLKVELQVDENKVELEREVIVNVLDKGYLDVYANVQIELERFGIKGSKLTGYIVDVKRRKYPLPRFHDIVRWMKLNGIGRPSTYAKIIQTLIDRRYVILSKTRKAFVVQRRGEGIYRFIRDLYGDIVSVNKTSELEAYMDMIERGEADYQEVLAKIYREVVERVISREGEAKTYVRKEIENIAREHGVRPECIEGFSL